MKKNLLSIFNWLLMFLACFIAFSLWMSHQAAWPAIALYWTINYFKMAVDDTFKI